MGFTENLEKENASWCAEHRRWESFSGHCLEKSILQELIDEVNSSLSRMEHSLENTLKHSITSMHYPHLHPDLHLHYYHHHQKYSPI